MDDTSLISGLSSIGEAIGESAYGRCVTLWITHCEPAQTEVFVRLGGPGSAWTATPLPMAQPLTVHRPPGVRVLRRATELAIATARYVDSADAESDELHRSSDAVVLDVLTTMVSAAAGTSMAVGAADAAGDGTDVKLTAAAAVERDGNDSEEEEPQSPLCVHLKWAIGEVLPGMPLPAEAVTEAASSHHSFTAVEDNEVPQYPGHHDEANAVVEADEGVAQPPHTSSMAAAAPAVLGDEDSTPDSSENISPLSSPPPPAPATVLAPTQSSAASPGDGPGLDAHGDVATTLDGPLGEEEPHHGRPVHESADNGFSRTQPPASDPLHHSHDDDVNSVDTTEKGDSPLRTEPPPDRLLAPLPLPHDPRGVSSEARESAAVSFNGNASSSSRSNTPRRQRPCSARRSTVQMDLAPTMTEAKESAKAEEPPTEETASVHISDDDENKEADSTPVTMHRPPPAHTVAEAAVVTPGDDKEQKEEEERPRDAYAPPPPPPPSTAVSSKPQPTAENLFEGVSVSAVVVSIAVVAVFNAHGAADPHRVVSVSLEATEASEEQSAPSAASSRQPTHLSFHTTPTLRSLAAVVPQMSAPTLLRIPRPHSAFVTPSAADADADAAPPALQVACTVREAVGAAAAASSSTLLWTTSAPLPVAEPAPSSSAASAPASREVRFDGPNGDVVVTQWTYLSVGAYRDAALNLQCRADEPGSPTLQLLLVERSSKRTRPSSKPHKKHASLPSSGTPTHLWVSSPATHANAVQHRLAAAAPAHALVHQPVHVVMPAPLVYVAVHSPAAQSLANAAQDADHPCSLPTADAELLLFHAFSDEWTRAASLAHSDVDLYYRVVSPAASVSLPALAPQLPRLSPAPSPSRPAGAATGGKDGEKTSALREFTITVAPPSALLSAVFTHSPATTPGATPTSQQERQQQHHHSSSNNTDGALSGWSLVLRHAFTQAVLASAPASAAATTLTYRTFLPLTLGDAASKQGVFSAAGSAGDEAADGAGVATCLPWELLLVPSSGNGGGAEAQLSSHAAGLHQPAPPNRATRRNSRSELHGQATRTNARRGLTDADLRAAWSGAMMISHEQVYTAAATTPSSTVTPFAAAVCVSAPLATSAASTALQSAATHLGATLEVRCAVRRHALDAHSAIFCLRSLRLVASPLLAGPGSDAAAEAVQPSSVRLWFSTSGGSAEEVQAAWHAARPAAHTPTEKELQRGWAPEATEAAVGASPLLHTDARGRLVSAGAPVLLTTTNTHARLCVAVVTPDGTAAASAAAAAPDEAALRKCVAAVRKRAMHRYKKARRAAVADGDDSPAAALTEQDLAAMYLAGVEAVAMRVDHYAEVDLVPSLVASSERPGHSRHRLLLSSVSGTVRLSRGVVLEVHGQWVKLPRQVAQVSDSYAPSPRLWAVRCCCVVRRTPDDVHGAHLSLTEQEEDSAAGAVVPLAQEVLEAERGYDVVASSLPLDYTDPSEETVQRVLPGLSYDKLVLQMKRADRTLQPFCETITTSATMVHDDAVAVADETGELLEHVFGPTGVAHNAYISDASHKVAVVHFVFGDAYTTRTVLQVTCAAVGGGGGGGDAGDTPSWSRPPGHLEHCPTPLRPNGSSSTSRAAPASVQVVCDGLARSATLYSFLPEETVTRLFPGVSHRRYPPELTWYHGSLGVRPPAEQQKRDEAQAAWQGGLTEQRLGTQRRPGAMVISAVTHHPYESLPLMVEASLTRCDEGRSLFVFGGVSTATGAASSRAFVLDVPTQTWIPLKGRRGSRGGASMPPRYGHTAVFSATNGAVYVYGGRGSQEGGTAAGDAAAGLTDGAVYSDVWRLEYNTAAAALTCTELPCSWAEAPSVTNASRSTLTMDSDSAQLARWRHAAVLHDDYVVVMGGQSRSGACCSCSELLYLDVKTCEWCVRRSFGSDTPSPRYGHVVAVSEAASLYLFGGWTLPAAERGAGRSDSALHSGSLTSSDTAAAAESVVAVADFYKMDLITRMWTRVEPNGALRPPALEMADMTSCRLDGCPVLVLVGGRPPEAPAAAEEAEAESLAHLGVYLFSTATLFWRRVAMDCTPVPTRFGLRALVSPAHTTSTASADGGHHGDASAANRLRRALPVRGHRLGDIVIVGGLPLDEGAVVETSPAITVVLAAGSGAAKGRAESAGTAASLSAATTPQQKQRAPRLPSVPRGGGGGRSASRRPATGPPRPTPPPHPAPPPRSQLHRAVPPPTLAWTRSQQQPVVVRPRSGLDGEDDGLNGPSAGRSVDRLHSASPHSRRSHTVSGGLAAVHPQRTSCYSTLTPRQQQQLVRRLYTTDLEVRAARLEMLEEQVMLERTTPVFHPAARRSSSSRSRSPRAPAGASPPSSRPPRGASAPFQRPRYDPSLAETPIATVPGGGSISSTGKGVRAATDGDAVDRTAFSAHRDLRSAFLTRSSSSSTDSSLTESSPTSSSADSASSAAWEKEEGEEEEEEEVVAHEHHQPTTTAAPLAAAESIEKADSEEAGSAPETPVKSEVADSAHDDDAAEEEKQEEAENEGEEEEGQQADTPAQDRYEDDSFASSSSAELSAQEEAEAARQERAAVYPDPVPLPPTPPAQPEKNSSSSSDDDDDAEMASDTKDAEDAPWPPPSPPALQSEAAGEESDKSSQASYGKDNAANVVAAADDGDGDGDVPPVPPSPPAESDEDTFESDSDAAPEAAELPHDSARADEENAVEAVPFIAAEASSNELASSGADAPPVEVDDTDRADAAEEEKNADDDDDDWETDSEEKESAADKAALGENWDREDDDVVVPPAPREHPTPPSSPSPSPSSSSSSLPQSAAVAAADALDEKAEGQREVDLIDEQEDAEREKVESDVASSTSSSLVENVAAAPAAAAVDHADTDTDIDDHSDGEEPAKTPPHPLEDSEVEQGDDDDGAAVDAMHHDADSSVESDGEGLQSVSRTSPAVAPDSAAAAVESSEEAYDDDFSNGAEDDDEDDEAAARDAPASMAASSAGKESEPDAVKSEASEEQPGAAPPVLSASSSAASSFAQHNAVPEIEEAERASAASVLSASSLVDSAAPAAPEAKASSSEYDDDFSSDNGDDVAAQGAEANDDDEKTDEEPPAAAADTPLDSSAAESSAVAPPALPPLPVTESDAEGKEEDPEEAETPLSTPIDGAEEGKEAEDDAATDAQDSDHEDAAQEAMAPAAAFSSSASEMSEREAFQAPEPESLDSHTDDDVEVPAVAAAPAEESQLSAHTDEQPQPEQLEEDSGSDEAGGADAPMDAAAASDAAELTEHAAWPDLANDTQLTGDGVPDGEQHKEEEEEELVALPAESALASEHSVSPPASSEHSDEDDEDAEKDQEKEEDKSDSMHSVLDEEAKAAEEAEQSAADSSVSEPPAPVAELEEKPEGESPAEAEEPSDSDSLEEESGALGEENSNESEGNPEEAETPLSTPVDAAEEGMEGENPVAEDAEVEAMAPAAAFSSSASEMSEPEAFQAPKPESLDSHHGEDAIPEAVPLPSSSASSDKEDDDVEAPVVAAAPTEKSQLSAHTDEQPQPEQLEEDSGSDEAGDADAPMDVAAASDAAELTEHAAWPDLANDTQLTGDGVPDGEEHKEEVEEEMVALPAESALASEHSVSPPASSERSDEDNEDAEKDQEKEEEEEGDVHAEQKAATSLTSPTSAPRSPLAEAEEKEVTSPVSNAADDDKEDYDDDEEDHEGEAASLPSAHSEEAGAPAEWEADNTNDNAGHDVASTPPATPPAESAENAEEDAVEVKPAEEHTAALNEEEEEWEDLPSTAAESADAAPPQVDALPDESSAHSEAPGHVEEAEAFPQHGAAVEDDEPPVVSAEGSAAELSARAASADGDAAAAVATPDAHAESFVDDEHEEAEEKPHAVAVASVEAASSSDEKSPAELSLPDREDAEAADAANVDSSHVEVPASPETGVDADSTPAHDVQVSDQWAELSSSANSSPARSTDGEDPFAPSAQETEDHKEEEDGDAAVAADEEESDGAAVADEHAARLAPSNSASELSADDPPEPPAEAAAVEEEAKGEDEEAEGGDDWEKLSATPNASMDDTPSALPAAEPPLLSSGGGHGDADADAASDVKSEEWEDELSTPQSPPLAAEKDDSALEEGNAVVNAVASAPAPSESDASDDADQILNEGRDLLDRRRGVEEEVQDDDFDF